MIRNTSLAICSATFIVSVSAACPGDAPPALGPETFDAQPDFVHDASSDVDACAQGCEDVRCAALEEPVHGSVDTNTGLPGALATFACDEGHTLRGSARLTCREDGSWDGEPPTCELVDCGALDAPFAHGTVDVAATTFHATATYGCEDGYELVGEVSRACQADGSWSGAAPTCNIVDCGILDDAPNHGALDVTVTTFGATATYTCDAGYSLIGDSSRTCRADGSWSNATPECQLSSCDSLDPLSHGSINTDGTTFGATATHTCDTGYSLDGDSSRTCQADGSWSGTAPTCNIVDCGSPGTAPRNGTLDVTSTTYGASATYTCDAGYILDGAATRTCRANGSWSGSRPSCASNPCTPNPCQNGGSCIDAGSSYLCSCSPPWRGQNCTDCGTVCSSRTSYYRTRFLRCIARNTQNYCLSWTNCRGDLYIDAMYGTLTFPKPFQCP